MLMFLLCSLWQGAPAIDVEALAALRETAQATHSDALLITQDGKPVVEWYGQSEPAAIELMSCLKSVVALGIGVAIHQQRLAGLDVPIAEFYPEWRQGMKANITVRHLMNHTAGLQNEANAGLEIYPSPDVVQLALAADLVSEPGARFAYNNKAVNLLAGVIAKSTGQTMDVFLTEHLLQPLGITAVQWHYDSVGNPHAMAGLQLVPADFVKFGQLILQDGVWEGQRLLGSDYLQTMLAAGQQHVPTCGLLWWRLPITAKWHLQNRDTLAALAAVLNPGMDIEAFGQRMFPSLHAARSALIKALNSEPGKVRQALATLPQTEPIFQAEHGPIVGYYAEGYLGNFLVVVPQAKLVAVRMVANKPDFDHQRDTFAAFPRRILNLLPGLRGETAQP